MKTIADDLELRLDFAKRLREITDASASKRPSPEKWSFKETIGHLIDSAANNHQRFVRLQMQKHLDSKAMTAMTGYASKVIRIARGRNC